MNTPRLPWTHLSPKAYPAMAAASATLAASSLGAMLIDLVQVRVSQINGCAFCLDRHVRDLRQHGEAWQRINSLPTWRETGFYTPRERAALAWAETMTRLADRPVDREAEFDALKSQFSDAEIVDLTWAVAMINTWNRMAIGMRAAVVEKPID